MSRRLVRLWYPVRVSVGTSLRPWRWLLLWVGVLAASGAACVLDRLGTQQEGTGGAGATQAGTPAGTGGAPGGTGGTSDGGSGATATGTGGNGGSAGTAGSGGSPGVEDCLNGTDDDGDSLVDCEDTDDCSPADYQCVPALGGGTYVSVMSTVQTCPDGTSATALHSCSGCDCLAALGTCGVLLRFFTDGGCSNQSASLGPVSCFNATNDPTRWGILETSLGTPPSCGVVSDTVPVDTAPACELAQAGTCPSGEACVPRNPSAMAECVLVDPATSCPPSYVTEARVYLGAVSQCSCSCATGTPQCTTAQATAYHESDSCGSGTTTTIQSGPGCQSLGVIRSISISNSTSQASCAASGTPVSAATASKLCCL